MINWLKKLFGNKNNAVSENQPVSNNQAVAESEAMPEVAPKNIGAVANENVEEESAGEVTQTHTDNTFSKEGLDEETLPKTE
ncbi:MAG TPA: hypothetical protein VFD51_00465 [Patescibacteria group bacterium]|nr:hypothetical protein [Patescibacteria group bacterium]